MFKQCVARAFDGACPAAAAKHPPHQGRLSGPELTGERHQHSPRKAGCQARSRVCGGLGTELGIADTELSADEARLGAWLDAGRHGEMDYMARHGARRARPSEMVAGTIRVITARLDYLPRRAQDPDAVLTDSRKAYISRYALGRDYHKVMRQRLQRL